MISVSPVELEGHGIRLEPLELRHERELAAAAADGALWELWFTAVPVELVVKTAPVSLLAAATPETGKPRITAAIAATRTTRRIVDPISNVPPNLSLIHPRSHPPSVVP